MKKDWRGSRRKEVLVVVESDEHVSHLEKSEGRLEMDGFNFDWPKKKKKKKLDCSSYWINL